jgi:hypothetical protein
MKRKAASNSVWGASWASLLVQSVHTDQAGAADRQHASICRVESRMGLLALDSGASPQAADPHLALTASPPMRGEASLSGRRRRCVRTSRGRSRGLFR